MQCWLSLHSVWSTLRMLLLGVWNMPPGKNFKIDLLILDLQAVLTETHEAAKFMVGD